MFNAETKDVVKAIVKAFTAEELDSIYGTIEAEAMRLDDVAQALDDDYNAILEALHGLGCAGDTASSSGDVWPVLVDMQATLTQMRTGRLAKADKARRDALVIAETLEVFEAALTVAQGYTHWQLA